MDSQAGIPPTSTPPSNSQNSNRRVNPHIAWAIVVVILAAALGYLWYVAGQHSSRASELEAELTEAQENLETASANANNATQQENTANEKQILAEAKKGAPYVLERPGLIPDEDKVLLEERLVNPLIDHYEINEERDVASVAITRLADEEIESSNYEHYTVTVVFNNGEKPSSSAGFIYGKGGEVTHWYPEHGYADRKIELTNEWKQKYPESAKAYEDSQNKKQN